MAWRTIRHLRMFSWVGEGDQPFWIVWCWTRLILYEYNSPDLYQWLVIHCFKPSWDCLTVEVFAAQAKFYITVINCAFNIRTACLFRSFRSVIAQFQLIKHTLLTKTTLHVHWCGFHNFISNTEWSNAQLVIEQTTTARTYHGLNWFGHEI